MEPIKLAKLPKIRLKKRYIVRPEAGTEIKNRALMELVNENPRRWKISPR
jgi:hypothetical protein